MPLQATSGAASQDAFGGNGVAVVPTYIEDVFSTWLYTGNGSTQTITNGIDLSTKGGLVWLKRRNAADASNLLDTARGTNSVLSTEYTNAAATAASWGISSFAFNTNGVSWSGSSANNNNSAGTYASWTFREQPKFFDVVTYTGNGTAGRTVAHNLGSVPGCIIVKNTSASGDYWNVYHRSIGATKVLSLNVTDAESTQTGPWNNTAPTSTVFSLGTSGETNRNGNTFVAYLFAHDAGGFGLTGTDNVISCSSYTGNGTAGLAVTLGYEPQWVMIKCSSAAQADGWIMVDNMRGMDNTANQWLKANSANAESAESARIIPTATGFTLSSNAAVNTSSATYIYIAIRRGPMKVPTTGTSVFSPNAQTGAGTTAGQTLTTSFPVDLEISSGRATNSGAYFIDRLRGGQNYMTSVSTAAEVNFTGYTPLISFANNTGILDANYGSTSNAYVAWNFRRAPSFFDEVCYTGTGSATTVTHNLAAVPELLIFKNRVDSGGYGWYTFSPAYLSSPSTTPYWNYFELQSTGAASDWGNNSGITATPTSTTVSLGTAISLNKSGSGNVLYLFATCAGVSKVGSYTGTATTKQIDCGFTAGARFVLIKRTDSTGAWYVWDTARGIIAGNDPYLLLNSTAAEVTNTDYIDTYSAGFEISSTAPAAINASGGTYIFLAIA